MSKKTQIPIDRGAEVVETETTLAPISEHARAFAEARANLGAVIAIVNDEIEQVKRRHAAEIKAALRLYNQLQEDLIGSVKSAPARVFEKPRTRQLHGIKVGLTKQPGKLLLQFDDARTIELIEKNFPDQIDVLVRVKRTPNVEALSELTANDLKRIGGHISAANDAVVCKAVDTDLDKLIKALTGDVGLTEETE